MNIFIPFILSLLTYLHVDKQGAPATGIKSYKL
jgi:hypothetical protein